MHSVSVLLLFPVHPSSAPRIFVPASGSFGAGRVYFAAYLLQYKRQLFTLLISGSCNICLK
jgi:hypothetical protein